jgi:hypothetical protein
VIQGGSDRAERGRAKCSLDHQSISRDDDHHRSAAAGESGCRERTSKGIDGFQDQTKRSKGTDADEAWCGVGKGGVKGEILVKEAESVVSSRG